ncbi:MAG: cupin domain-containing protein [Geobacteraceae bacterium]|nr:cupin domain-containing protein [Geobacteraceae bacterium]
MSEVESKLSVDGAHAYNLAQMTEYQEGAVVSRTLLKNSSGTLTVFSFDAGQALSEHTVPFNAFIQVLDGEGEISVDGKTTTVKSGEIILMPGGLPHSVHAAKRFKMLLTMFRTKVA